MATPKPPKNLAPYNKELRRIERFMRSAEQRGFTFLTDIPEQKAKPTKRDVERLKKLTPEKLYSRAYYTDDSGNQVPASPQRGGKWMPTKSGQITVSGKKQNYQAARRAAYKRMARAEARRNAQAERAAERRASKAAQKAVAKREAEQARQEARSAGYQISSTSKRPTNSLYSVLSLGRCRKANSHSIPQFFRKSIERGGIRIRCSGVS